MDVLSKIESELNTFLTLFSNNCTSEFSPLYSYCKESLLNSSVLIKDQCCKVWSFGNCIVNISNSIPNCIQEEKRIIGNLNRTIYDQDVMSTCRGYIPFYKYCINSSIKNNDISYIEYIILIVGTILLLIDISAFVIHTIYYLLKKYI